MATSGRERREASVDVHPFRIEVPESELDDLAQRLDRTRWPELIVGTGWERGVPLGYLRGLVGYWRTEYDWRRHEAELNALPQFTTTIDGQRVHFIHVRSSRDDAMPLMLLHGWPGSVVEFLDVIDPLAHHFHLVIPSLPGHGLSGPITEPGWTDGRVADAFLELMTRLGYHRFGAQGGGTGAFVAPEMGRRAPERLIGVHVNAFVTIPSDDPAELAQLTERERERLEHHKAFRETGMATTRSRGPVPTPSPRGSPIPRSDSSPGSSRSSRSGRAPRRRFPRTRWTWTGS